LKIVFDNQVVKYSKGKGGGGRKLQNCNYLVNNIAKMQYDMG
jgi:hypothetical protein